MDSSSIISSYNKGRENKIRKDRSKKRKFCGNQSKSETSTEATSSSGKKLKNSCSLVANYDTTLDYVFIMYCFHSVFSNTFHACKMQ